MSKTAPRPEFFAISTGQESAPQLAQRLHWLGECGVSYFLLREKAKTSAQQLRLAHAVQRVAEQWDIDCFVAQDARLAVELSWGVHLSEHCASPALVAESHPGLKVGVSLHDPVSRSLAEIRCCHHVFLSPLFATRSKADSQPLGLDRFLQISRDLPGPTFALGGLERQHFSLLWQRGIRRWAGISMFAGSQQEVRATLAWTGEADLAQR